MKSYKELLEKEFLAKIESLGEEGRERYNSPEAFREDEEDGTTLDAFLSYAEKVLQKFDEIGLPPKYAVSARFGFEVELKWETHELSPLWCVRATVEKRKEMLKVGACKVSLEDLIERVQNAQKPHPFLLNPVKEPLTVYAITYSDYDEFGVIAIYTTKEEAEEKLELLRNNPLDDFIKWENYSITEYNNTRAVEKMWHMINLRRED